ncbi:MAG: tetratricopeptide repeat protein [Chitinophagaceae bacterium]
MNKLKLLFLLSLISIVGICQTNYYPLLKQANKLREEKKIKEAIEIYLEVEKLKPYDNEAISWLGWCYNDLNLYSDAVVILKKAKPPFTKKIFHELGFAYRKLKLYNEAVSYFESALILEPKSYSTNYQLAKTYEEKKDIENAITYYKICENIVDEESRTLISATYKTEPLENLMYCYNSTEKYYDAIVVGEKAISKKKTVFAFSELGYAYYKIKQNEKAIDAYKQALSIDPKYGTAYKGIGDVYRRNYSPAKTSDALENYKKAVELNPYSAGSNFGVGWCLNEQGKYYDASFYLVKAINLDNNLIAAYTELGYAQYMQNLNTEAINTFKKGITLESKNKLCRYYLGLVYVKIKEKSNALTMVNELYNLDQILSTKLKAKVDSMY